MFSATGPTVNMRTSIAHAASPAFAGGSGRSRVGGVAQRDVEQEHERGQRDALDDVAAEGGSRQHAEQAAAIAARLIALRQLGGVSSRSVRRSRAIFLASSRV